MITVLFGLLIALPAIGEPSRTARASEQSYEAQVERAVFTTCPAVLHGDIDLDTSGGVARTGLRRAPGTLEAEVANQKYGKPKMVGTSIAGASISLSYYPGTTLCIVTFEGPQREAVYDRIKAKVLTMPGFAPDPANSGVQGPLLAEAFRATMLLELNHRLTLLRSPPGTVNPMSLAIIGYTKD